MGNRIWFAVWMLLAAGAAGAPAQERGAAPVVPAAVPEGPAAAGPADAADTVDTGGEEGALSRRITYEAGLLQRRLSIMPHRSNVILPATYNFRPNRSLDGEVGRDTRNLEVKFQISFKVAVLRNLLEERGFVFFGYTQQSWWQLYNLEDSSPFRETNYEPELFFTYLTDYTVPYLRLRGRVATLGLVHQSNGSAEPFSRSWNRVFAQVLLERGRFVLGLKPWWRIPEAAADDDNPDIEDYAGRVEVLTRYVWGEGGSVGLTARNNLRVKNRGSALVEVSLPVTDTVSLYAQYFLGYGESLVDHDHVVNRVGVGLKLKDWL